MFDKHARLATYDIAFTLGAKTIHEKNLLTLMVEIYKTINNLNPVYMSKFFIKKEVLYDLHMKQLCRLLIVNSQKF